MSWRQRFREMVLAGGAGVLSVVGCGDSNPSPNTCCNANPDPCCPSQYCGGTVTAQCTQKTTCESDGGTWDYSRQQCSRLEDSATDAVPYDFDAGADAEQTSRLEDSATDVSVGPPDVRPVCCNANPDPCCPYLHCGEALTSQCTEKMACEADGGTWDFGRCVRDAGADGNGQSD
jgi:hypothetical protein